MIWFRTLIFATTAMFTFVSFAQDNSEEAKREETVKKSPKKFEKVEVTGSRIRRTDFEGPTPVMVIDRTTLDDTSYNSISDVLRDMPISNFGAGRETTGSQTSGSARVSLRGQGAGNTLVMINGTRLQRDGVAGAADLNLIPEIAIESSDILLDGASAIYGADAIGGVLHIKTRKDFTGVEASVRYTQPEDEGGTRIDFGVIGGQQWEKLSVTAAYQFRLNDELRNSTRPWLSQQQASPIAPTPSYFGDNGTPGDDSDDRWTMRPEDIAACNADPNGTHGVEADGDVCRYKWANIATNLPEIEQHSAYVNTVWTPNSRTTLDTSVLFTNQISSSVFAPAPALLEVDPAAVGGWGVTLPGLVVETDPDTGNPFSSFRHRVTGLGNRMFEFDSLAYNVTSRLTREFGETWSADAIVGYGSSATTSSTVSGSVLRTEFNDLISAGSYNPYAPNSSVLDPVRAVPSQDIVANELFVELSAAGELFELANGQPISAAVGVQFGHSYYENVADADSAAGNIVGGASSGGRGYRDTASMFLEIVAPITNKVEVQAAVRADSYSDFGAAVSPMVALKYAPKKSLLFRASAGKAFKAPTLQTINSTSGSGFATFIDQVQCDKNRVEGNTDCNPNQYFTTSVFNDDLEPEEAINLNVGAVYAPSSNFSISADVWQIDQSNLIGLSNEQITFAELRDPSGAALAANGITVDRAPNGRIRELTAPLTNLAGSLTRGANINILYKLNTDFGTFRFSDQHSHIFTLESEPFPGIGAIDFLNDVNQWRNTVSIGYAPTRLHNFTVSYGMVPEYNNGNRFGKVPFYGEMDLSYQTQFNWGGTLNLGIKNVLAADPPVDPVNPSFRSGIYNPLGRYAFLNYRQSF